MNDAPKTLDPNFYHQLAECINALGEREFYGKFFTMIKSIAKIDQYMVFEFSEREDSAVCRLAHNSQSPDLGIQLASQYLDGAYLNDTMLEELKQSLLSQGPNPSTLLQKRSLPAVYRNRFFNIPKLETKFAFVVLDKVTKNLFYINFYCKKEHSLSPEQIHTLELILPIISASLLKHFRDERQKVGTAISLLSSGLSEREAQICDQILQGHTAKSIANKLGLSENTVVTYKNRAFKKLKISHKSELVQYLQ